MKFRHLLVIQCLLVVTVQLGCGFNDGFRSEDYHGVLRQAPQGSSLNIEYPYEIHSKNAKHVTGFPSIFFQELVDNTQVYQVVAWNHWLNNDEKCYEETDAFGNYLIDCGDLIGELTVFLTYSNVIDQQNTLFVRQVITSDETATEQDVFPGGR